ncbi:MAG: DHH family phosphoesterase [Bacilli bacterium]|jgi:single-stranded-DNA-specific exonuclease|nr:DHH family phosphoesterase [Bacilli bacterium]
MEVSSFLGKLLSYYGLSSEDYERLAVPPSVSGLPDISGDPNVKEAIARLSLARERKERVLIYGDYDTDGVMSAAILCRAFREFGLDASAYLPSRYIDGYGLTAQNVERIAAAGYGLIFTCDNGVTAHEALLRSRDLGLDVIVLDHHDFDGTAPECLALVHADRLGLRETISAGLLSYSFARALLGKSDGYLLTLGALSTLSDVMPLQGVNRDAVRLGLALLNENRYPSLTLLSDRQFYDERTLQMEIIPKINAVGRLCEGTEINRLLGYFAFPEKTDLVRISAWLNEVNGRRKELTRAAEKGLSLDPSEAAIVVVTKTPEGLNGLLASRLLNEYGKPVCVLSPSKRDPSLLVGSLRSEEGFNVLKALEGSKAPLLSKGGHAFAGGLSLKATDLPQFKKDLLYSALKHQIERKRPKLIPLSVGECTMENYRLIASLGPFGNGHEAPRFLLEKLDLSTFGYIHEGAYLSTKIAPGVRLFSFRIHNGSFPSPEPVALAVTFSLNEWKGRRSLDLLAEIV